MIPGLLMTMPWLRDKIWEWPGDEARSKVFVVVLYCTSVLYAMSYSAHVAVPDRIEIEYYSVAYLAHHQVQHAIVLSFR